jgi:hypothetical protein
VTEEGRSQIAGGRSRHRAKTKKQRTKDPKKRRLEASYGDANPVKITKADGTVEIKPPYTAAELREMGLVPAPHRQRKKALDPRR